MPGTRPGMTVERLCEVYPFVPAEAGTQRKLSIFWIPAGACPAKAGAGMNGVRLTAY
jgi:hypothetical protein